VFVNQILLISPYFPSPESQTPTPESRVLAVHNFRVWGLVKCLWMYERLIHTFLKNVSSQMPSPEFRVSDAQVLGFGGPRTRDLICETGHRYLSKCVNQFVCKSNFIDLSTFPKSQEPNPDPQTPNPETQQSTILGFGGW
jgi:hypothetical protein